MGRKNTHSTAQHSTAETVKPNFDALEMATHESGASQTLDHLVNNIRMELLQNIAEPKGLNVDDRKQFLKNNCDDLRKMSRRMQALAAASPLADIKDSVHDLPFELKAALTGITSVLNEFEAGREFAIKYPILNDGRKYQEVFDDLMGQMQAAAQQKYAELTQPAKADPEAPNCAAR